MKRLLIILLLGCPVWVQAQDSLSVPVDTMPLVLDTMPKVWLITDSMPHVTVVQDSSVARMLYRNARGYSLHEEVSGYRVQIFSSNKQQSAKNEAIGLQQRMEDQVEVAIYVTYTPPFWKVRLGDFVTYEQANDYKRILVTNFPELSGETYVVRDQVKVMR